MRQYIIVDIDGTISDANARAKTYLEGDNPDWDGFYAACGEDTPITPVIRVIEALAVSYNIVFCTGRRESCEAATREWLNRHARMAEPPRACPCPLAYPFPQGWR